jgi:hypothetical protein
MADRRCAATNREGEPCAMAPLQGSAYCWAHDATRGAERAKARREGGRRRAPPTLTALPAAPGGLRSIEAIQMALEATFWDTQALANSAQRSRALASLLMIAAQLLKIGEHESRLQLIEAQLATGPRRIA